MEAYRIADARCPIFDPMGAALQGARWNSAGKRVIYAAETYAVAMLEILVHRNGSSPPRKHKFIRILIPEEIAIETVLAASLPGWDDESCLVPQAFGDKWYDSKRTAILRVPSVATGGIEFNLVLNTLHPLFGLIRAGRPEPVVWDARL